MLLFRVFYLEEFWWCFHDLSSNVIYFGTIWWRIGFIIVWPSPPSCSSIIGKFLTVLCLNQGRYVPLLSIQFFVIIKLLMNSIWLDVRNGSINSFSWSWKMILFHDPFSLWIHYCEDIKCLCIFLKIFVWDFESLSH